MKWIEITDSLPPYSKNVLLTVEGDQTQKPPPKRVEWGYRDRTDRDGEHYKGYGCSTLYGYVTHWMPLPSASE